MGALPGMTGLRAGASWNGLVFPERLAGLEGAASLFYLSGKPPPSESKSPKPTTPTGTHKALTITPQVQTVTHRRPKCHTRVKNNIED